MTVAAIDVGEWIDKRKVSRFQIEVLLLACLMMFLDGFDSQGIGYVVPDIVAKWGVPRSEFGPVFAGGLFGLALGPLLFGALADRFGRKTVIVICLGCFGLLSLLKVLASSVNELLILQFVTGLFCGGAMPNGFVLINEYSPRRTRAFMVMLGGCGFALGATGVGLVASRLLPIYGWQSIFLIGGVLPLLLLPWTLISLPESIRFMALRPGQRRRLERVLTKIDRTLSIAPDVAFVSGEKKLPGMPVIHLLSGGMAPTTLLLWAASFMDFTIIYFVMSWLPVMMTDSGFSMADAAVVLAMYPSAGVIGSAVIGRMMDKYAAVNMLALSFALAAVFIALLGALGGASFAVVCLAVATAGFFAIGGHNGMSALAGELYPTFMRSTGVGWTMGVGRFCSMVSPIMGGLLIEWRWRHSSIFLAVAAAAFLAALSIFLIRIARAPKAVTTEPKTEVQPA